MKKSKSSRQWLDRHLNDEYVKRAQRDGYRSRAAYKLLEINKKDQIIVPSQTIVDLGAAPGGWSQIAGKLVGPKGKLIALDILPMDSLAGVDFIQGDFREDEPLQELRTLLDGNSVDLVISDMAPNVSGMAAVDQPQAMYLCELALEFAQETLRPRGDFLIKVFQGAGFEAYLKELRASFAKVVTRKPAASRAKSREVYLLARGYNL